MLIICIVLADVIFPQSLARIITVHAHAPHAATSAPTFTKLILGDAGHHLLDVVISGQDRLPVGNQLLRQDVLRHGQSSEVAEMTSLLLDPDASLPDHDHRLPVKDHLHSANENLSASGNVRCQPILELGTLL